MQKLEDPTLIELSYLSLKKKYLPIPNFLFYPNRQRTIKQSQEFTKFLIELGYDYLCNASQQRKLFVVMKKKEQKIFLIEIKELNQKSKSVYLSMNITASLKNQLKTPFLTKKWQIHQKITLQDDIGTQSLVLITYHFSQYNLQTYLSKLQSKKQKITLPKYQHIAQNLIQNLCEYHLNHIVLGQITPNMIISENNFWFILFGDHAEKITQDWSSKIYQPLASANTYTSKYSGPFIYEMFKSSIYVTQNKSRTPIIQQSKVQRLTHNAFKSDVYSLGLCLLQLQLVSIMPLERIQKIFSDKRQQLPSLLNLCYLNLRESYFLKCQTENKASFQEFKISPFLSQMICEKQSERSYIFEICLMTNFTQPLTKRFKIPYQNYFKAQIFESNQQIRINYPHANIQYQGNVILKNKIWSTTQQSIKRQGKGKLKSNGKIIFEGQWKNNHPFGKCKIQFNELLTYQGHIINNKFSGNGIFKFNQTILGTSKWYKNLQQNHNSTIQIKNITNLKSNLLLLLSTKNLSKTLNPSTAFYYEQNLKQGLYLFVQSHEHSSDNPTQQYKVFYRHRSNSNITHVFNLFNLKTNITFISKWLVYKTVQNIESIKTIKIKGIIDQSLWNCKNCQQIQMEINDPDGQTKKIIIVTDIEMSYWFLIEFLSQIHSIFNQKPNIQLFEAINQKLTDQTIKNIFHLISKIQTINLSHCQNLTQNTFKQIIKNIQQNQSKTLTYSLNLTNTKITNNIINSFIYTNILSKIKTLKINNCKISYNKLTQLINSDKICGLENFQINQCNINNQVFDSINVSNNLKSLKFLSLNQTHKITENLFSNFLAHKQFKNLVSLSLRSCSFKDSALQSLKTSSSFSLQSLDIAGCINFSQQGLWKLLSNQKMQSLRTLDLSFLCIDDNFLSLLSSKSNPFELYSLTLEQCRLITSKGLNLLINSRVLGVVNTLNLSKTAVDNSTLHVIGQCSNQELRNLNISKCPIMNDEGLQKFSRSVLFPKLQNLNLNGTRVGDRFIKSIAKPGSYNSLQQLNLNECKSISETGLENFMSSNGIKYIEKIHLTATLITKKCVKAYQNNINVMNNLTCLIIDRKGTKSYTTEDFKQCNEFQELIQSSSSNCEDQQTIQKLCKSGYLIKMNEFTLTNYSQQLIKNASIMFKSKHLINLNSIKIDFVSINNILDSLTHNLINSNLKQISLHGCQFDQKMFLQFLRSQLGQKIQNIDLSWTQTTNSFLQNLSQSDHITTNIKNLKLSKCLKINDKGLIKFIHSSKVNNLCFLDLRSTLITNLTIQAISSSKNIKNLKKLIIRSCNNLRDIGFKDMFKSKGCKGLQILDFSWSSLNGQIFEYMSQTKNICKLQQIYASGIKNCQKNICKYLNTQFSSNLTTIDLSYTNLTYYFFQNTYKSPYLKFLIKIYLKQIDLNVIKKGWMTLAKTTYFRHVIISNQNQQFNIQPLVSIIIRETQDLQKLTISGMIETEIQKINRIFRTNKVKPQNYNEQI